MDKSLLIFIFSLLITTVGMAKGFDLNINNLIAPPAVIQYQGSAHAVFDMGGMKYLYRVTQGAKPFPQCNAIQAKGKELMVFLEQHFLFLFLYLHMYIFSQEHHFCINRKT